MILFSIVSMLFSLVIPIVGVVLLVKYLGGRQGGDGHGVRRFFQYGLLLGLVVVAAIGVSELVGLLVDRSADGAADLARALTFTVFGVPMAAAVAGWARRDLRRDPGERLSLGWAGYVTAASLVALVVSMTLAGGLVATALSGGGLDGVALVGLGVWGLVWAAHWVLGDRLLTEPHRRLHLALGSLAGLGTSIVGLVWLLGESVTTFFWDAGPGRLVGSHSELAAAAATLAVGVPVWWLYWPRRFAAAPRRGLWLGYVLPVGVGGSLVMTVAGAATALYAVLVWFLGDSGRSVAQEHFEATPTAAAAVLVGGVSWWYHRQIFARGAPADRTEVTRVHEYLLAGIALVTAGAGLTLALVALLEAVTPGAIVEVGTSAVNSWLAAATLVVVGGPLWWLFWRRVERVAADAPGAELGSPTRRTYLFLLFGVGGVVAVVVVLVAAFIGIRAVLEGTFDGETVRSMRTPIALLVTTGAISGYHWLVYRRDRAATPAEPSRRSREVLLVGPVDDDLVAAVQRATGARVELWARPGPAWVTGEVLAAVAGTESRIVAVVLGEHGVEAFGVDARRRY